MGSWPGGNVAYAAEWASTESGSGSDIERKKKEGRENKQGPPQGRSPPIACLSSRLAFCSDVALLSIEVGKVEYCCYDTECSFQCTSSASWRIFYYSAPYEKPCGSSFQTASALACEGRNGIGRTKSASAAILSFIYVREGEGGLHS